MLMMRIFQLNATSLRNKRPQLIQFLKEEDVDIMCISETFLKPTDVYNIPFYDIIRTDRPSHTHGGGVAIVIKRSI